MAERARVSVFDPATGATERFEIPEDSYTVLHGNLLEKRSHPQGGQERPRERSPARGRLLHMGPDGARMTTINEETQRLLRAYLEMERDMGRVLLALEMTSCGITASLDSNGGGAFSSSEPRSGDHWPPHLRFLELWRDAGSTSERRRVLERARDELDQIRRSRAGQGAETEGERTERLLEKGEGFTASEVALAMRMTEAQVRRTRARHGRDPEKGMVEPMRPMPDATPAERRERARLLRDKHRMSTREIGLVLGVDHSTIVRDLSPSRGSKAA